MMTHCKQQYIKQIMKMTCGEGCVNTEAIMSENISSEEGNADNITTRMR